MAMYVTYGILAPADWDDNYVIGLFDDAFNDADIPYWDVVSSSEQLVTAVEGIPIKRIRVRLKVELGGELGEGDIYGIVDDWFNGVDVPYWTICGRSPDCPELPETETERAELSSALDRLRVEPHVRFRSRRPQVRSYRRLHRRPYRW